MTLETMLSALTLSLVMRSTPGPNNLMLLTSGVNHGLTRTFPHLLGIIFGVPLLLIAVGFGLGSLFQLYPQFATMLKVVALVYLIYLSWQVAFSQVFRPETTSKAPPLSFGKAILFQWINPKAWATSVTLTAIYVGLDNLVMSVLLLGFIFFLAGIPTQLMWTSGGKLLRRFLEHPLRLRCFNFVMGVLLILSVVPMLLS